jgi:hypothetical protein
MDIKTLALIMLGGHLVSVGFMASVIVKQWGLFKRLIEESLKGFRRVLFALSILILVGNIIPIFIDTLTLFYSLPRPLSVSSVSVFYALSNAYLAAAAPAIAIWVLYKMAERSHSR